MFKWKKKAGCRAGLSVVCVAAAGLIAGNVLAWQNLHIITQYFGQSNYKIINSDADDYDTQYYKPDYATMDDLQAAETEFATRVQSEGSVLLQNKNLPIAKTGKITLLGSDSSDAAFIVGGSGSSAFDTTKKPSLEKVFTDAGYEVNPVMIEFYEEDGKCDRSSLANVGEAPQSAYTSQELNSYKDYKDVGIVFIGRTGQEGNDVSTTTTEDASKSILELSQNELDLIDSALANFDKVVVLLNTMNAMELAPLLDKNVSILWIGAGGQQGLNALPGLLNGTYNPSGKLVDTFVYDSFSAPSMQNFGAFEFTNVEDTHRKYYYNYAENIYIGYKYYETRYADVVTKRANVGEYNYENEVVYPFGYGISLTQFTYSDFTLKEKSNGFDISVKVTNSGEVAGKEAVQIYFQAPYTDYDIEYGVEKSAVELAGFAKTGLIAAGKSETVIVSVPKEYLRSYDAQGARSYIVEEGTYYFTAGKNAHDGLNNILAAQGYTKADGMTADGNSALVKTYEQDETDATSYSRGADGELIENEFDDASYTNYDPSFKYLTRSNWTGTWPAPLGGDGHKMAATEKMLADLAPATLSDDPDAKMPETNADNGLTLASLIGVGYDSEYWDKLLDQMTASEMMNLVGVCGYGSGLVTSVGKPATLDRDGPVGVTSSVIGGGAAFGYPTEEVFASSWNLDLQKELGYFMGNDAIMTGMSGLYAPAVNMHRTPFGGRNFEYYSEDSLQSGLFAATFVEAMQAKGVYCFVKHFAVNDQENNRESAATFLNEQTLREIYLRPFELTVTVGDAHGMMAAKNRIGCVWTGASKALLTDVLRDEWGFIGAVVTDSCTAYFDAFDAKYSVYAGLDMYLTTASGIWDIPGYQTNATLMNSLRRACHNQLYIVANSLAMNNIGASSRVVFSMPAWGACLIAADVILGLGAIAGCFFMARSIVKSRRVKDETQSQK